MIVDLYSFNPIIMCIVTCGFVTVRSVYTHTQVLGLLLVAGSWSHVLLQFSRLALGGVWASAFFIHITLCTRSSSCSQVVCGRHSATLLLTAVVFASLCSAGSLVIVAITIWLYHYIHRHHTWTSKVTCVSALCVELLAV